MRVRAHLPRGDRRALRRVPCARAGARRGRGRDERAARSCSATAAARLPARAHVGRRRASTCRSIEDVEIPPGERRRVRTGLRLAIRQGHAGLVLPRSGSRAARRAHAAEQPRADRCRATAATCDVIAHNTDLREPVRLAVGDRIAQLVLVRLRRAGTARCARSFPRATATRAGSARGSLDDIAARSRAGRDRSERARASAPARLGDSAPRDAGAARTPSQARPRLLAAAGRRRRGWRGARAGASPRAAGGVRSRVTSTRSARSRSRRRSPRRARRRGATSCT